eukprot:8606239-Alexandrium_andersonii.AAC.1
MVSGLRRSRIPPEVGGVPTGHPAGSAGGRSSPPTTNPTGGSPAARMPEFGIQAGSIQLIGEQFSSSFGVPLLRDK